MNKMMQYKNLFFFTIVLLLSSCSIEPQAINFGEEDCDFCKMTISDNRYGAEALTQKGRVYKFDDLHCMKAFLKDETVESSNIHSLWVVNFEDAGKLINVEESFFLHNEILKSPMGSNIAAFDNENDLKNNLSKYSGTALKWADYFSN